MDRSSTRAPETPAGLPGRAADGREQILDVLRAGGLRFRAGGRWRRSF
ncbi:hypothetical protein [Micromonospora sp. NPDC049282]